jgi:uncharacterized membrane protein
MVKGLQNKGTFLVTLIFLVLALCAVVLFNVNIARQIIGFLFLTFVPGIIVVKILKLSSLDFVEKLLLSVGLSLGFLMIAGFFVNELLYVAGFIGPLQLIPLLIILIAFVILGGIVIYAGGDKTGFWHFEVSKKDLYAVLVLLMPILSVIGVFLVNIYENSMLLLVVIIVIPLLFCILLLSKNALSTRFYPLAVFAVALALLYQSSLISSYVFSYGSDSNAELGIFRLVNVNQYWNATDVAGGRFYSMLGITILPAFYSKILSIDPTTLFKILYPFIFACVPVCMYKVWQNYIGKKYALIAAFLFMAQQTFYTEMIGLNREIVAELFFALLLLVIFAGKMKPAVKFLLFLVLSFGLITSHYGLALIFSIFILVALVYSFVTKHASRISVSMVTSFLVLMFAWYIFTSGGSTFATFVNVGNWISSGLVDFLSPTVRGSQVLLGIGLVSAPSLWNTVGRLFAYATEVLIVTGTIGLLTRRIKFPFDRDYLLFTFVSLVLLVALIVVPVLANTLNMTRFYHILLFFLAPIFVLGANFILSQFAKLSKHKELLISILILAILVPYFFFQTGFVYEVTGGDSFSVPLSEYRMDHYRLYAKFQYTNAYDANGANWFYTSMGTDRTTLFTDLTSNDFLVSFGQYYSLTEVDLSNVTQVSSNGTVFLGYYNVIAGGYIGAQSVDDKLNITDVYPVLDDLSTIYSNGACLVYRNTG